MAEKLTVDQAIFTSVRTPMGEGYRIIASSRGLRPQEKQVITRNSPSHDALCETDSDGESGDAAAFYALPTGRLCVAYTCSAGAEHTGRGGSRVYTYNVIFRPEDFPRCRYNPFAIVRAMIDAGLGTPDLTPANVLPELELSIREANFLDTPASETSAFPSSWRIHCLQQLLDEKALLVNLPESWEYLAETLLMGLPGPLRSTISLAAGLRYSVNRGHVLSLTHDPEQQAKKRIAGREISYISAGDEPPPTTVSGEWQQFVERHWECGDLRTLACRTSQAFADTSTEGRDHVGRLYNQLDAIQDTATADLLGAVDEHLREPEQEVVAEIVAELAVKSQEALLARFDRAGWTEAGSYLDALCSMWRSSDEGCLFAWPLIEKALDVARRDHPTVAADAALGIPSDPPSTAARTAYTRCIDAILTRLADWADNTNDDALDSLPALCERWLAVRPQCPIVDRIRQRCDARAAMQTDS